MNKKLSDILAQRNDITSLARRQREWSMRTFGGYERNAVGPALHLIKEIQLEMIAPFDEAAKLFDCGELSDALILLLDMIWRSGTDIETIIGLAQRKMDANETRSWPARPNGQPVEHDRSEKISIEEATFNGLVNAANNRAKSLLMDAIVPKDTRQRLEGELRQCAFGDDVPACGMRIHDGRTSETLEILPVEPEDGQPLLIGTVKGTGAGVFVHVTERNEGKPADIDGNSPVPALNIAGIPINTKSIEGMPENVIALVNEDRSNGVLAIFDDAEDNEGKTHSVLREIVPFGKPEQITFEEALSRSEIEL